MLAHLNFYNSTSRHHRRVRAI